MLYAAISEDLPEMLFIHQTPSKQHIAYLKECRNEMLIGGGLRDEPGCVLIGCPCVKSLCLSQWCIDRRINGHQINFSSKALNLST